MTAVEIDLRERARVVACATLEQSWPRDRFELELESEHDARWSHTFERSHYAAGFRVFEFADTAAVTLGPGGRPVTGVRFPVDASEAREPLEPPESPQAPVPDEALRAARGAAEDAARRAGRWQTLRSRVVGTRPASGEAGALEVFVRLYACVPEGPLTVDLDGATGDRLGFFVPSLLRGSRGGRPLSKRQAVARLHEAGAVPASTRFVRGDLEEPSGARVWRLVFEAVGVESFGQAIFHAHARSGAVVGFTSTIRPRVRLGRPGSRERAWALVEKALPLILGPEARLANLVVGAVLRGGRQRAGWLGTVLTEDRAVLRVSLGADEVEIPVAGKPVRVRVGTDRAVLVNDRRRARARAEPAPARPVGTEDPGSILCRPAAR